MDILLVVVAYLLGSLSSAIIVCKLMGLPDPRGEGSGNPGATNVLRFGGKKAAVITLLGDVLKGLVPVLVVVQMGYSDTTVALVAAGAFLGHLYPLFFGFKGGKGVATAVGALLGIHWMVGLAAIATWLVMAFTFRYSSLSAMVASVLSPLYMWWITASEPLVMMNMALSLVLLWRHRSNMRNLLSGKEGKIGKKSA